MTGATSGIGAALATQLVARDVTVFGVGRNEARLADFGRQLGKRFIPVRADLSDEGDRARAVETLLASGLAIDILVNNAAECAYGTFLSMPLAHVRRLFEVNLFACLELAHELAPGLTRGSHILNVSSVTARFVPNPRFAPYALTKLALEEATRALRLELSPRGIKVSAIAFGLVDTPIYDRVEGFAETREKLDASVAQWLSADDAAHAIVWVVSQPPHVVVADLELLPLGQSR
ncbi:MAG TPA: SDR family NAD(P)-dependent oxidoreductase [Burkholderiales bacterium]|nr:SDR family NAD(P)-dependent oxidoreductase [Burkholderiales bacterium]